MDKNQKDITTEVTVSIQAKKFRFALGWKQTWSLALLLALAKFVLMLIEQLQ